MNTKIELTEMDVACLINRWLKNGWSLLCLSQITDYTKTTNQLPVIIDESRELFNFDCAYWNFRWKECRKFRSGDGGDIIGLFYSMISVGEIFNTPRDIRIYPNVWGGGNWWENLYTIQNLIFKHEMNVFLDGLTDISPKLKKLIGFKEKGEFPKNYKIRTEELNYVKENIDWLIESKTKQKEFCEKRIQEIKKNISMLDNINSDPKYQAETIRKGIYKDYLNTGNWKIVRLATLHRYKYRCQVCNSENQLEVHHRSYKRLGNELPNDLIVLDHKCHELFHKNGKLEKELA